MKPLVTLTLGVVLLSAAAVSVAATNPGSEHPPSQIDSSAPHDTVFYGGLEHVGFTHLQLDTIKNILGVPAEPSSGRLGVSTRLGTATAFHQYWLDFDANRHAAPAFLEHVCLVPGNSAVPAEHVLGSSRVSHVGGMLEYSADYAAIGATSYTVEIYLKGKLVASVNGLVDKPFVQTSTWPSDGGVMLVPEDDGDKLGERLVPASAWGLQSETPILIVELNAAGEGKPLTGDEIRIIPENPRVTTEAISRLTLRGLDIPLLQISDETLAGPAKRGIAATAATRPEAISLGVAPNPVASGDVRVFFRAPSNQSAVNIGVYDVSGRNVRTLFAGIAGAENAQLSWDGADGAGRPVAAGTYFLRLDAGATSETRRVTIVR